MSDLVKNYNNYNFSIKGMEPTGLFYGYASIVDLIDRQKDIIMPGAFVDTKDVKLLWQHDPKEPIGLVRRVHEDGTGLYVEGRLLLDVKRGAEAYSLIKSGALSGLSIGYTPIKFRFDKTKGVRILSALKLWEVSLVTFPANPLAKIFDVKKIYSADELADVLLSIDRAIEKIKVM